MQKATICTLVRHLDRCTAHLRIPRILTHKIPLHSFDDVRSRTVVKKQGRASRRPVYHARMVFGDTLRELLRLRGLSGRAFARAVGASSSYVHDVLAGRTGPPDAVEGWADALLLQEAERSDFLLMAHLARAHPLVQDHVADLRRRVEAAESARVRPARRRRVAEEQAADGL